MSLILDGNCEKFIASVKLEVRNFKKISIFCLITLKEYLILDKLSFLSCQKSDIPLRILKNKYFIVLYYIVLDMTLKAVTFES